MREAKAAIYPAEFEAWLAFYKVSPFDDDHWFYRPAALIASSAHGAEISELMSYLRHDPPPAPTGIGEVGASFLKAFGLKPPAKE